MYAEAGWFLLVMRRPCCFEKVGLRVREMLECMKRLVVVRCTATRGGGGATPRVLGRQLPPPPPPPPKGPPANS